MVSPDLGADQLVIAGEEEVGFPLADVAVPAGPHLQTGAQEGVAADIPSEVTSIQVTLADVGGAEAGVPRATRPEVPSVNPVRDVIALRVVSSVPVLRPLVAVRVIAAHHGPVFLIGAADGAAADLPEAAGVGRPA